MWIYIDTHAFFKNWTITHQNVNSGIMGDVYFFIAVFCIFVRQFTLIFFTTRKKNNQPLEDTILLAWSQSVLKVDLYKQREIKDN